MADLHSSPQNLAPIGVFDSGVGGLSVLRAIRRALPHHPLLYVADTGHAPYGDRSTAYIQARAEHITQFLVAKGAQALVVACNTASAHASKKLRADHALPVVAIEPAIKPAAALTQAGCIAVLATSQTLASPSVAALCERYGAQCRIVLQACPGLADQVNRGELDSARTQALLAQYLAPVQDAAADVVVLGCTHYPFLSPLIQSMLGPDVTLLDPAAAVARELLRRLGVSEQAQAPAGTAVGDTEFFSSGPLDEVRPVLRRLWDEERLNLLPM